MNAVEEFLSYFNYIDNLDTFQNIFMKVIKDPIVTAENLHRAGILRVSNVYAIKGFHHLWKKRLIILLIKLLIEDVQSHDIYEKFLNFLGRSDIMKPLFEQINNTGKCTIIHSDL